MNPARRVRAGLQDVVCLFPKNEGHSAKKTTEERRRLIWNVSEVDRLLDVYIHGDQCHLDAGTCPCPPRVFGQSGVCPQPGLTATAAGLFEVCRLFRVLALRWHTVIRLKIQT